MRFSDEEYLRAWKEEGVYPKIHDKIYQLFATTCESDSVLDLCACTGLLGQRIQDKMGLNVVAVEGDPAWIERGKRWGTNIPTLEVWVLPNTLKTFTDWIRSNEVTGIVARRCISELFGNDAKGRPLKAPDFVWSKVFTDAILDAGIKEIWLEGRADQGRSVHPVPDTETEAKCFFSGFKLDETYKTCAYLTAK